MGRAERLRSLESICENGGEWCELRACIGQSSYARLKAFAETVHGVVQSRRYCVCKINAVSGLSDKSRAEQHCVRRCFLVIGGVVLQNYRAAVAMPPEL